MMLISASAPGTTGAAAPNPAYPAVYAVILNHGRHVALVRSLFYDESTATSAHGAIDNLPSQPLIAIIRDAV
jgi:hypothetical protein